MDFEQVLDMVGGAGQYQVIAYLLIGISVIPAGMHNMANLFLTALPDYHCMPPPNSDVTPTSDVISTLISDWLSLKYNPNGIGTCKIYDIDYGDSGVVAGFNVTSLPADSVPDTVECTNWKYDQSVYGRTATEQWNLVCGEAYKRSLAQSIYMTGFSIGAVIFGSLADSIGRKKSWMLSMVLLSSFGVAASFTPEYWSHVFLRFVSGMAAAGLFGSGFILGAEIICKSKRLAPAVMYQIWFAIGYMIVEVGVAYVARDYAVTLLTLSLLVLPGLIIYWFVDESPRWLITQGKTKEAVKILQKIANRNKKEISKEDLQKAVEEIVHQAEFISTEKRYSVLDLLKTPNMRKKTLNLWFNWFIVSLAYYGLSINSSDLAGSPYLNLFVSGLVETPGLILAFFVAQKFGRKMSMMTFMVGGGVACLLMLPVPESLWWLTSTFANLGKLGISGAFGIVYVLSAELSPTVVRTIGVGSGSMCACIGGLIAPFIGVLGTLLQWEPLAILIFGLMSIVAGLLVLMLPETLGITIPDTIEQGEKYGKDEKWRQLCCNFSAIHGEEDLVLTVSSEVRQQNGQTNHLV